MEKTANATHRTVRNVREKSFSTGTPAVGLIACTVLLILLLSGFQARAEVNVTVGMSTPFLAPAYLMPSPPPVVVIAGTYVYFAPGLELDILFYRGYWYRSYGDHWYRSYSHNGPWGFVPPYSVPRALVALPPHYRYIDAGYARIPYGQLKKNWGRWERERHWDSQKEWRHRGTGHGGGSRRGRDRDDGGGSITVVREIKAAGGRNSKAPSGPLPGHYCCERLSLLFFRLTSFQLIGKL
jgi:hypothetical protein